MPAETQDANPAAGDGSVRYYLMISNLDGGSDVDRFANSFEVSGFSFDLENESGLKTDFNPLEVDLSMGTATDELAQLLLKGNTIQRVRLVAVNAGQESAQPIYDLRLGDAMIRGLSQSADGSSHLAIDYAKVTLTTQNDDGSIGTHGWDRIGNVPFNEQLTAPTVGDDGGETSLGVTTWYLTIDGMDGGSRVEGHEGAFVLRNFQFDLALAGAIGAGGGSGKPQITPIDLKVEWGSAADEILNAVASGKTLPSAQIVGVAAAGDGERTTYDLRLENVALRDAGLSSGVNDLSIDYTRLSLTTSNSLGAEETISYDRATNTSGTTQYAETAAVLDNTKTGGGAATYYIKIDGLDGGSAAKGHKGAFEISGFDLDLHNTGTFTVGGGGGTGKTQFAPLDITLNAGSDATRLMEYISTGKHIRSVQITSDQKSGDGAVATGFDLRFANVNLEELLQTASGDKLSLGYGSYSLTTVGTDGTEETTGWDIAENKASTTEIRAPKPADHKASDGSGKLDYYLVVDGVDGGSTNDKHAGAFEIKAFSLDIEDGSGKAQFGNLKLDVKLGSDIEDLIALEATGKHLKSIQLVGDAGNDASKTIYDLRLGGAQLSSMIDQASGLDHLSFSFNKYSLATVNDANKRNFYGFDLTKGTKLDDELGPVKAGHGAVGGNLDYYMNIDGLDGGSSSDEHAHSFKLSDLDFKFSRADDVGTVDVKLNIGTAGDELMQMIAMGKSIKSIEIAGEHRGPDASGDPYDLRLNSVRLTSIHQDAEGNDILSLQYSRFSLTTEDAKGDAHTSGYDGLKRAAVTKPLTAAHAVDDHGAAGGKESYHLLLDGLNGGDAHVGLEGAFTLAGFDFDIDAAIAGGGGGGTVGKTTFQPIHIALQAGSAADELMLITAAGQLIDAAEIVGDIDSGDGILRSFDLRLSDVLVSSYRQSGVDTLELSFGAVSLTTTSQDAKGVMHTETYAFDLGTQTGSDQPLPAPVPDI